MWQAKRSSRTIHHFQPGVNEDLAAPQSANPSSTFSDSNYDGIFHLWYAKGPGVDPCGDVLRHGNLAGTAKYGGVLLLAGDDHTCKSSTTAHRANTPLWMPEFPC
jgi:indolepyruvate ferredoxin oxidoreductase